MTEESINVEQITLNNNPLIPKLTSFLKKKYKKEIIKLTENYPQKKSLVIDFAVLSGYDFELAEKLLEKPDSVIKATQEAIKEIEIPMLSQEEFKPNIRFNNLPKDKKTNPLLRDIGAEQINKLIVVEGVIRQITDVLPKLKKASFECRRCGNIYEIIQEKRRLQSPAFCECRHKDFKLIEEKSKFIDSQKLQIQEPLELLKGREQSTFLDVYLLDDLVNKVNAGDRVELTGIIRLLPPKDAKDTVFRRYFETIHLSYTEKEFEELEINEEEEKEIKKLAKDKNIFNKLIKSIAPGIYGHETVKEAIILQLFGGTKKIYPNQSKIRGNIHILLVGDPGCGKSQILMAADKIAPKSIYVGGKSISGVGITASAQKDDFGEGGWVIKAGALVLASGGMGMIDEFDKIDKEERGALHEAMEQESVSVAKAGIVTRFKTETSILAAANPKFSRFDEFENPLKQINLPATLLSRFDLYFVIRDVLDRTKDEQIASHILQTHKAGQMLRSLSNNKKKSISKKEIQEITKITTPEIQPELLRKYIAFARQKSFPILTKQSMEKIKEYYVNLREKGKKEGMFTATHRQLEALVRLSEASAKIKLKKEVEEEDVERATKIFKISLEEVSIDPETNTVDIDIITTGQSHSQTTNMKKVLNIIREKALEFDKVPIEVIINETEKTGINEEKCREMISMLKKKGEIYEPRHGLLKPTQT